VNVSREKIADEVGKVISSLNQLHAAVVEEMEQSAAKRISAAEGKVKGLEIELKLWRYRAILAESKLPTEPQP
jgi:hypothetical protein